MNNIKKLSKIRMRMSRRTYFPLLLVVFLSFTFAVSAQTIQSSISKTEEQRRFDIYGQWQGCIYNVQAQTARSISKHSMVDKFGIMSEYATAKTVPGVADCVIGTAEKTVLEQGRIKLIEGRLPERAGEIAIEKAFLPYLGYSYDLGQTISMELAYIGTDGKPVTDRRDYYVCGILKSFSANWNTAGNGPVSGLITATDPLCLQSKPCNTAVFSGKYYDEETIRELSPLLNQDETLVFNSGAYPEYTFTLHSFFDNGMADVLIFFSCFSFVFYTSAALLSSQRYELRIMCILGASKRQLRKLFLYDFFHVFILTAAPGSLVGIAAAWIILKIRELSSTSEILFQVMPLDIVIAVALVAVATAAGTLWPFLSLGRTVSDMAERKKKPIRRPARSIRTEHALQDISFRKFGSNPGNTVTQCFITLVLAITVFMIFFGNLDQYTYYMDCRDTNDAEYIWSAGNPMVGLSDSDVDRLRKSEGIENVDAVVKLKEAGRRIGWQGSENSEYLALLQDGDSSHFTQALFGIESDSAYLHYMLSELDEGTMTADDFDRGEAVILLPDLERRRENNYRVNLLESENYGKKIVKEDTLTPGDHVFIETEYGKAEVKIGGIIRSFKEEKTNMRIMFTNPGTLLMSKQSLDKILGGSCRYNLVLAYSDVGGLDNSYMTDKLVSRVLGTGKVYFQNVREENESLEHEFTSYFSLSLLFLLVVLLLGGMIVCNAVRIFFLQEEDEIRMIRFLGAEWKQVRKLYFSGPLIIGICSTLGALVLCAGLYYMPEIVSYITVAEWRYTLGQALRAALTYKNMYFPLPVFIGLCVFFMLYLPMMHLVQLQRYR